MATWEECNKPIAPITPPPRPSGGDSNLVRGTFSFDEAGTHDISIPYTGNGYPVAVLIGRKDGAGDDWKNDFTKSFATLSAALWKEDFTTEPTYEAGSDANKYFLWIMQRSTQASLGTSVSGQPEFEFAVDEPAPGGGSQVKLLYRIRDAKTLSVYVCDTTQQGYVYGLAPNIEYQYYIIYADGADKTAKVDSAIVDTSEVG